MASTATDEESVNTKMINDDEAGVVDAKKDVEDITSASTTTAADKEDVKVAVVTKHEEETEGVNTSTNNDNANAVVQEDKTAASTTTATDKEDAKVAVVTKHEAETVGINTSTNNDNANDNAVVQDEESSEKPILETLTFGLESGQDVMSAADTDQLTTCPCLLCDVSYPIWQKEHILAHLVMQHRIVIADVTFIADLPAYLQYWKKNFEGNDFGKFCSTICTNNFGDQKDNGDKEEFFLLCDALPEDKELRSNLQQKRLEYILTSQEKERCETQFLRQCLFCKQVFCGNRSALFEHLLNDHSFHMGLPDNLVFTDELFDLIQFKLDNYLCLFCEKKFRDKVSLREHMRKKQHRKINPKNKEYDRFYIINYMEVGKNWESLQSEERQFRGSGGDRKSDEEDEWAGWNEETESKVVCLFCDDKWASQKELHDHMKDKHDFDLPQVSEKLQLNFYQKIKLINYIRRQIYHKRCYGCKKIFPEKTELFAHVDEFSDHLKLIPDVSIWDQPQYFFPTYEDDKLLCLLDDNDDDGAAGDALGVTVIAEDIKVPNSILDDADLCKDLKKLAA